jgi:regulator of sigma E protease
LTVAVSILGLGLLIFAHELGHFVVARMVGIRPRRFYVGFPPAIWKTTRGGVEYGLGAVPLGGFVKIPGMHAPEQVDVDRALGRLAPTVPELANPTNRLRAAILTGDHSAGRESIRQIRALLPREAFRGRAGRVLQRRLDNLDEALGSDAYWRAPAWKRVAVIAAGPLANVAVAIVLFAGLFMTYSGELTTRVDRVIPGSPAASADLRPGDRILAVDGHRVTPNDVTVPISGSAGRPIVVTVERGGATIKLAPVRAERVAADTYRLGFTLAGTGLPIHRASWRAVELTGDVSRQIGSALARLVIGEGRNDLASPVGAVQESSDAVREGTTSFVAVLALISLSLALVNLLPLLPLDGGHIVFAAAEGVRGRSARRTLYERASVIGIGIVLVLFVVGLSNDIGRLT